ncbi:MAG: dienelactone hydrolase family protein [Acidobacteria bacterium]|nr:dienelactone hydrolase family protein [Acidobacteriota bacterium]
MGETISFKSNGHDCRGNLSVPADGSGPAVVVIQEWWGLVDHIEDVVDQFAASGFLAFAPDLYHGKKAKSPDDAKKLMMELEIDSAVEEISGAGEYLLSRRECTSSNYGVVGFCMGGGLAQMVATRDRRVGAAASFYGVLQKAKPDWDALEAPILLIYGETDLSARASEGIELQKKLRAAGKNVDVAIYPNAGHAFFNDSRPEVYVEDAAQDAFERVIALFREHLPGAEVG